MAWARLFINVSLFYTFNKIKTMAHLSLKSRPLIIMAILLLAIALPFFFVGGPKYYSTPLFRALWDCGHIVFFAGLVVALSARFTLTTLRAGIILSVALCLFGGSIEIIQSYTGRDGNWQDVVRDIGGGWLGLFWLHWSSAWVWLGRVVVVVLLVPSLATVFFAAQAQQVSEQQFPMLANFETTHDLYNVKGPVELSADFASAGQQSLKVKFSTAKYSDVYFINFFNSWQGYQQLSMDIYNPGDAFDLALRIDDVKHHAGDNNHTDRFNKKFHIQPAWNTLVMSISEIEHAPATRLLNLDTIYSMILFSSNLPKAQVIYIDNVQLR